jgi:hypothetical protein
MDSEYFRIINEFPPEQLLRIPVKKLGAPPTGFLVLLEGDAPSFPFTLCPIHFVQKTEKVLPKGNPHDVIVHYEEKHGSLEKLLYLLYQEYQDTACQSTNLSLKRYLFEKTLPPRKVLIPSFRRQENLEATLRRFKEFDLPIEGYLPMICIVEHSPMPELEQLAKQYACEYLWILLDPHMPQIPVGQFNRALCFDKGVIESSPAEWYLCHDNDLLMAKDFWERLDANLNRTGKRCIQPYTHRCVLYLKPLVADNFRKTPSLADQPIDDSMHLPMEPGAAGGSLYIHRDRYIEVGGHDPNLCWGYAPEDMLFFKKLQNIEEIAYADNPPIKMLHLWHPPAASQNPLYRQIDFFIKYIFLQQSTEQMAAYISMKRSIFETILRERGTR